MSTERSSSIPTQPEEYRAILAWVCTGNWIAIAAALLIEVLLRTSNDYQWPHWGGFSWMYNIVLIEFAVVNSGVMLLLRNTEWLDRAPREALARLHWLLLAVLLLTGLHLLGFFHMTGGIQGPIMILLPPVLLTACLLLPRRDAQLVAVIFMVSVLLVVLRDSVAGAPQGMLAGAFTQGEGMPLPWLLVAVTSLMLAALVGLAANGQMEKAGTGLRDRLSQDPQTGLYAREVLERRVPGELARIGRSDSTAVLLMIGFNNMQALLPRGDYAGFDKVLHEFADGLRHATRAADTCARYDVASFAALLPTASSASAAQVVDRIQHCCDGIRLPEATEAGVELAIGVASVSGVSQADAAALVSAANQALQEAHSAGGGHQVVIREL